MSSSCYLATTGLSNIWDMDRDLLILGPWCLIDENNKRLVENKKYAFVSSPWKPVLKLKDASDYCYNIYEKLLPELSENLNSIHQTSYTQSYWRVLMGHWLLYFTGVLYDRYKRIENAFQLFPDFCTHVLPMEQCKLATFDMYDFFTDGIDRKVKDDYYNLKLFSLAAYDICPDNIRVREHCHHSKMGVRRERYGWKRKLFNKLTEPLDLFFKCPTALCDMYHLSLSDMALLKLRSGFKVFSFIQLEPMDTSCLEKNCSYEIRSMIKLKGASDRFQSLLYRIIPEAMPMCYLENYKSYRSSIRNVKNMDFVKIVGSAVGWVANERFKFFAAEAVSRGARLIDFQHGGGYGTVLGLPQEKICLEKDIFYTWGWKSSGSGKTRPLPSPHLYKIRDSYNQKLDNILFVGSSIPGYQYITQTGILPDDMPKYFEDKKVFLQALQGKIRSKILYRPYALKEWPEERMIGSIYPNVNFAPKGKLVDLMKKAKLVVIDHPRTSFIEALAINCPSIFYWDHEVFLMRPDSEKYFNLLRDAGILFRDPLSAARKVEEVYSDPMGWWLRGNVQNARVEFCRRYAYTRPDWMRIWKEEFELLLTEHKNR